MRDTFGKRVVDYMKKDKDIIYLMADAGNGDIIKYGKEHPDQVQNIGIMEQAMCGIAAGMAITGKTVIMNSIGNFVSLRCLEQIRNDIAYHNLNVKICCTGGGLSYGPAGVTHHTCEDFSMLSAIPNMHVFAPGDCFEEKLCVDEMLKLSSPCYLRIGYHGEPNIHKKEIVDYNLGDSLCVHKGDKVAILTAGTILNEAEKVVKELAAQNVSVGLYSFPCIKPLNKEAIKKLIDEYDVLITMEENVKIGGFGSAIAQIYCEVTHPKASLHTVSMENQFSELIGSQNYLRKMYHLDKESIITYILTYLKYTPENKNTCVQPEISIRSRNNLSLSQESVLK